MTFCPGQREQGHVEDPAFPILVCDWPLFTYSRRAPIGPAAPEWTRRTNRNAATCVTHGQESSRHHGPREGCDYVTFVFIITSTNVYKKSSITTVTLMETQFIVMYSTAGRPAPTDLLTG